MVFKQNSFYQETQRHDLQLEDQGGGDRTDPSAELFGSQQGEPFLPASLKAILQVQE